MFNSNPKKSEKTASDNELELEYATKKYILGEIDLEEYRREVAGLETRLDLRKVVTKLRPILVTFRSESAK
jgi:hypothetical protein